MLQYLHHGLGSFSTKDQDKCSVALLQNQNTAQPQYLNFIYVSDISGFFFPSRNVFSTASRKDRKGVATEFYWKMRSPPVLVLLESY